MRSLACLRPGIAALVVALAACAATAPAATLTWDADGTTTGSVTDGAGAWLGTGQWWDGSSNLTWTSGDDAIFGVGGTGGAVTLSATTAANSLTFNAFTGTYTLGTSGITLTLGGGGLTMNAGAGAVTLASPVTLSAAQSWTNTSSSLLTAIAAIDNGGNLLTLDGSGNTTLAGSVSGVGGLTKSGSGTLTLSASNAYTGNTTLVAGTLRVGGGSTTGALSPSSAISGSAGATLAFSRSNTVTQGSDFAGTIGGALNVSQLGSGTLVLNGANTFTGTTRIQAGTLSLGNTAALQNSTLDMNSADAGALVFGVSGTNTYVVGGLIGSRNLTLSNTVVLSVGNNGSSGSYTGVISGSGGLVKTGAGTLTLGNVQNTFTGGSVVNGGVLTLGTGLQNGNIRGSLTINAGATVNANAGNWSLGYGGTRSGATYGGISVTDIAINGGLLNFTNGLLGAGLAANSIVLTGGTIGGTSFGWINSNTLTPTLQTLASSARSTLSGGISLRLSGSGTLTFDVASGSTSDGIDLAVGPIVDAGGDNNGGRVIKTGAGRMVLTGSNTFTGGLTLSAGQLDLNHASALGSGTFTITGGSIGNSSGTAVTLSTNNAQAWNADVAFAGPSSLNLGTGAVSMGASRTVTVSSGTLTVGGTIAGTGFGLTKAGAGTLVLGAAGYTGNTTVNAGTLQIGAGSTTGTLSTSAAISGSAGATLAFARSNTVTQGTDFPAVLSGPLNLSQAGAGTLVLNGANTFTGTTRIVAGTLSLGNTLAIQNSTLDLNSADAGTLAFGVSGTNTYVVGGLIGSRNLTLSNTVVLSVGGNGSSGTYSGVISGSGGLVKTGTGTLTLGNVVNSFTGGTVVSGGTLTLGNGGANGNIRGSLTINAGATVNADATGWSLGYGGTRSGAEYSGNSVTSIAINGGLLNITNPQAGAGLAANSIVLTGGTIGGGSFGWYNTNTLTPVLQTLASSTRSTLSGGISLRLSGSGTLTFDVASGSTADGLDLVVSGPIANAGTAQNNGGNLAKTGAGTLLLSGSNAFTGGVTVTGGTLAVQGWNGSAGALPANTNLTITNATVTTTGTLANALSAGQTTGVITINSGGLLFAGNSAINAHNIFDVVLAGGTMASGTGSMTGVLANWYVNGGITATGSTTSVISASLGRYSATANQTLAVTVDPGSTLSVSGPIVNLNGANGLTKSGSGLLSLSATNTFTGGLTVSAGTLQLTGAGVLGSGSYAGAVSIASGAAFALAGSASQTLSGVISGSGGLVDNGAGALTLSGTNTFSGGLTLSSGLLNVNNASALGTGTFTITGGTLGNSSGSQVNLTTTNAQAWNTDITFVGPSILNLGSGTATLGASRTVTVSTAELVVGSVTGAGFGLTKAGAGKLSLSGSSDYTGPTDVTSGTLQFGIGGTTGAISPSSTITGSAGATLAFARSNTITQGVDFASTIGGALNVSQVTSGTLVLNGANTFTGTTRIVAGTLSLGGTAAIQNSALDMNAADAGTLVFGLSGTNTYAVGGLVGSRNIALPDGVILGVGGNGTSGTYSGVLSGSGSLTKAGAGTLTLTGVNSYTGGTVVDSGTLTLGTAGFDGVIRGSLTINAGDTVNASQNWSLGAGGTNSSQPTSRSVTDVTINGGTLNFTTHSTKGGMSPTTLTMTGASITGEDFQWYYGNSSSVSLVTQASATTSTITPGLVLRLNKTAGVGVLTLDVASGTAPGGVDLLISGQIRNATEEGAGGRLVKTGAGTLVLSGNNTFTEGLTLSAGQVNVNTATALGSGAFTITGGTIGNSSGTAVTLSTNNTQAWNADVTFVGPNNLTLGSGAVTLGASRIVTVSTGTLTVNGVISGSGFSLTKSGAGTLSLGNVVNTYSGGTIVDGGTLALGGLGSSGNNGVIRGSLTINQGAAVNADAKGWSLGYGGTRSGATYPGNSVTSITINGGLLNFTNPESGAGLAANQIVLTGGTIGGASFGWIESNTLTPVLQTLASSTRSTLSGGISLRLSGSGTLTFDVASGSTADGIDLLVSGPITDNSGGRLAKTGAGTLVLSATNTFAGAITLSTGTLRIADAGVLGSGNYGGNIAVAAAATFDYATSANQTLSGVISGSGGLLKTGAGTLTLTNANTFTGGVVVTGGTLSAQGVNGTVGGLPANTNVSVTNATLTTTGSNFNAFSTGWTSGTITINAGGLLSAGNTSSNAHNLFDVVLAGGTMAAGTGSLNGALANWYVNGGITATGSTTSVISASLGKVAASSALAVSVDAGSTLTVSGPIVNIGGANGLTKTGAGLLTLSATNTYTGATTVSAGTLALSGGWAGTLAQVTVANVAGTNATLAIQSGSYGFGGNSVFVGNAATSVGIANQTGGSVTFTGGNQLLIGTGSGGVGAYTLSGGTITTAAATAVGVMLGVNTNASGTFTMTGGALNMTAATGGGGDATLLIGRSGATGENGQSGAFIQSGGVASVGILSIGGNGATAGTGGTQVLTLTGGTFGANQFPRLSAGNSNVATITIGGSADVTLPAFPTARGSGATAAVYFDGGTLRPAAASAAYMSGLTNAFLRSGGITFDVPSGRDITIGQTLLADGTSPGGGLVKTGSGTLTLGNVTNTYSGGTVVNGGTLTLGSGAANGNIRGSLTINQGATVNASATNWSLGYGGTRSGASYSGTSVTSITINGGLLNITNVTSGAGLAANSIVLTGGTIGGASFGWINTNTLTPVLQTLASSAQSTLSGGISLRLSTSGTLTFDVASGSTPDGIDLLVSGSITDATAAPNNIGGNLVKTGAGRMVLSGANTFTGGISLSGGTVQAGSAGALGSSGTISFGGGTLQYSNSNNTDYSGRFSTAAGQAYALDTNGQNVTLAAGLTSGGGSLAKSGAGTLTLTGSSTFAGGLTVSAGTLQIGGAGVLGSGSYGGAIAVASGAALAHASSANQTLAGTISGAGELTKSGAGRLTLSASNTYTGTTTISGGTLALSGAGDISSAAGVSIASGAALDISAASGIRTINTLSGSGNVRLGGNTLRTVIPADVAQFDGVISGSGGFTKAGEGRLDLTNLQTFTGTATVEAGGLLLSSGTGLAAASRIFVASGASIESAGGALTIVDKQTLGGYGTVYGPVSFASGGILSPGGSVGTLTNEGSTTWNAGFTYVFEVNDANGSTPGVSPGWDLYNVTGDLTLAGSAGNPITIDLTSLAGADPGLAANFNPNFNYAWKFVVAGTEITTFNASWFTVDSSGFQNLPGSPERFYVARGDQMSQINATGGTNELFLVYAAVPEPGTLALAGIGLAAAAMIRRRARGRQ